MKHVSYETATRINYLGYVSCLGGHIIKDNNTDMFELWLKDVSGEYRLRARYNDMAFAETILQDDAEAMLHLHQLAA